MSRPLISAFPSSACRVFWVCRVCGTAAPGRSGRRTPRWVPIRRGRCRDVMPFFKAPAWLLWPSPAPPRAHKHCRRPSGTCTGVRMDDAADRRRTKQLQTPITDACTFPPFAVRPFSDPVGRISPQAEPVGGVAAARPLLLHRLLPLLPRQRPDERRTSQSQRVEVRGRGRVLSTSPACHPAPMSSHALPLPSPPRCCRCCRRCRGVPLQEQPVHRDVPRCAGRLAVVGVRVEKEKREAAAADDASGSCAAGRRCPHRRAVDAAVHVHAGGERRCRRQRRQYGRFAVRVRFRLWRRCRRVRRLRRGAWDQPRPRH